MMQRNLLFLIRTLNRIVPCFPEKTQSISRDVFVQSARQYIGMKYVLGADGTGDSGIDCSHLICGAMIDAGGAKKYFYRTAHDLYRLSEKISLEELLPGDLVFWTDKKKRMKHVAIFLSKQETSLSIIDASGPSSGLWSTTERSIDLEPEMTFGRPPFFDAKNT